MQTIQQKLALQVRTHQSKVWKPPPIMPFQSHNIGWFTVERHQGEVPIQPLVFDTPNEVAEDIRNCIKVDVIPNASQKAILKRWLWAYFHMYLSLIHI